jgi:hypothetical protein
MEYGLSEHLRVRLFFLGLVAAVTLISALLGR